LFKKFGGLHISYSLLFPSLSFPVISSHPYTAKLFQFSYERLKILRNIFEYCETFRLSKGLAYIESEVFSFQNVVISMKPAISAAYVLRWH